MNNKDYKAFMDDFAEAFGDTKVQMTFRDMKEGMDSYFALMGMTVELVKLFRVEDELKKHHRAYLHVREDIDRSCDEVMAHIHEMLDKCDEKQRIYHVSAFNERGSYPFAEAEDDEDEETITISKDKYESMVEDLLTMAELIDMVSDMRTKDIRFIREMGKLMPAYVAYEKSRLSLYHEASKEAEEIFDCWEDELDEDYEPDEYFSD